MKKLSRQTIAFAQPPGIAAYAAVVGKKEGEGPLGDQFDRVCLDTRMGQKSWELAESALQKTAMNLTLQKAGLPPEACDFILGGDLLNQCISTALAVRDTHIPFLGLYGACSTMAESMLVGACLLDGGFADHILAGASSHFCSAERQYRFPCPTAVSEPPLPSGLPPLPAVFCWPTKKMSNSHYPCHMRQNRGYGRQRCRQYGRRYGAGSP